MGFLYAGISEANVERLLEGLVQSATDGIVAVDSNQRILVFNRAAERIFRCAANDAMGSSLDRFIPERFRNSHNMAVDHFRLARGEGGVMGKRRKVFGLRSDGSEFPIDATITGIDLGDKWVCAVILRDITEQLLQEERLRRADEKFRLIVRTSPFPMITLSVDGVVQSWNPAAREVFGWTEEEVVGRLLPTVLDSELDQFQEFLISVAREKTLSGIERRRVRKDGTEIDVRIWTVLMEYPEEGGEKEILIVLRDVTEEKEAKKQLDQAMKMEAVGRLAGGVAHDFNNLLTIIAGYAGMVKSALPENDPLAFDIEEVVRAAERARLLTSQLLAFSRRQVIQPKILDPNILVRNVSKMIQRLIGEDIQIVYNLRSDGSIRIDPGQFEQVLMNLCINSRDAMPEGGVISISTERSRIAEGKGNAVSPGEYIIVSVSDTGHGMDKQTKAHIFEPYFTTKEVGKGTGLGLPTIYGIVKQNAGHITFSSEQGRGTEFRIFFPLIRAEAGDVPASHTTNLWPRGTETILVLEDEDGVRNLAMRILQNQGYTVIGTDNGIEARRICLSGRVDLLLSDIVLPGVRGTEIANQMKALCSGMKVLLMTGYADREVGSGTRVLVKPFSPEALVRMVREVLDESTK